MPDGVRVVISAIHPPTVKELRKTAADAHRAARDLHDALTGGHYRRDQQKRFLAILGRQRRKGLSFTHMAALMNRRIALLTRRVRKALAALPKETWLTNTGAWAIPAPERRSPGGLAWAYRRWADRQETEFVAHTPPLPKPARELLEACEKLRALHTFLRPAAPPEAFISLYKDGLAALESLAGGGPVYAMVSSDEMKTLLRPLRASRRYASKQKPGSQKSHKTRKLRAAPLSARSSARAGGARQAKQDTA
jgi:hypothetical protein